MSTTKLAEALPPLPDVELAEIRNDSINKTRLSETGAHYWGSNWREVRKLYTAEQMRDYALAAVAQSEAKPVPVPADPTLEMLKAGAAEWLKYGEHEARYPLAQGFDKLRPDDAIHLSRLTHVYRAMLGAAPAAPAPHPLQALTEACEDEQNAIDAERYRWLRDAENGSGPSAGMLEDWKDGGWERVHWYYEDELDAAIDAAIEAGKGEQA